MKTQLPKISLFILLILPFGLGAQVSDLIFSEYGEGSASNKYLELYNGTGDVLDLGDYTIWKITNDGVWFEREFVLSGPLEHGDTYLIVNENADSTLMSRRDTVGPPGFAFALFNGNEAFAIVAITGPDSTDREILDVIGVESGDVSPDPWDVAGVEGAGAEHTWVRKSTVCAPNTDWESSAGTNADDSEWIVYDADTWDDAGMHTSDCGPLPDVTADLFFSEYGEGSSDNKYLEIFNGTGKNVDLAGYTIWKIINDGNWFEREFIMEGILADGETYLIVNKDADTTLASIQDTTGPIDPEFTLFNGNEAFALVKITGPDTTDRLVLDVIGEESGDVSPDPWDVAGVVGAGAEHTWIRKATVCGPNADWPSSAGTNADDSEWIVLDADTWTDAGMHNFTAPPAPEFADFPADTSLPCDMIPDSMPGVEVQYVAANGLTTTDTVEPYILGSADDCGGTLYFVYSFTDVCGKVFSNVVEVTITPAPEAVFIDPPADITVDFANIPDPMPLVATNAATCPIDTSVMPTVLDNSSLCGGSITYTWSFTDECGRIIAHSQTITVEGEGGKATELFFSEYGEGSGDNKYLEIYNGTPDEVDLSGYTIWKIINDGNWFEREFILEGTLGPCETYLIVNKDADAPLAGIRDTTGPIDPEFTLFNGNEAFALVKITGPDTTDREILDVIGEESGDVSPEPWDVAGVVGAGAEHTWVRKASTCGPNSDWASSAGTNAENSEWIVYDADYWDDAGLHTDECDGDSPYDDATDIFFSEYGEGSNDNKYLEIFNATGNDVDLSGYTIWKIINDGNWFEREFELEGILPNFETYLIVNKDADKPLASIRDTTGPVDPEFTLFNGNEAYAIVRKTGPNPEDRQIIDVIGVESGTEVPEIWQVAGVIDAGAEHTWIRKETVCGPNDNWASSAGTNAENSEWIVFDADYWDDAGQHTYKCMMVEDPMANVTFQVDLNQETVSTNGVHIAGSFQGWDPAATPMSDGDGDGVYEVTVLLPANVQYEYKFINGNDWGMDESVPTDCAQNGNRYVDLGTADITLDAVCFASCGPCVGVYPVTFRVNMSEETVSANGVHIAGNFQNWDPAATQMLDGDGDGIYEVTVDLNGNNTYQYKFINGNAWGEDESVPEECALSNNRFLEVGTAEINTAAFCFGSCTECTVSTTDATLDRTLALWPNPTAGDLSVRFHYPVSGMVSIKCYNVLSQMVYAQQYSITAGDNLITFGLEGNGVYLLVIETEKGIATRKVIVE